MRGDNPPFIILDTSVLLQLIVTDHLGLLRSLLPTFQIQAAIVPAVEVEVLNNMNHVAKFRGREAQFRRALGNGALAVVNHELLRARFGTGVEGWTRQIDLEGERLNQTVDRGEAYSHAASSVLAVRLPQTTRAL